MAVCNATDIRAPAGGGPAKQQQRNSSDDPLCCRYCRAEDERSTTDGTHVEESSGTYSSCNSNGNSRGEFHAVCPLSLFPLWDGGQSSAGCRSTSILSLLYSIITVQPGQQVQLQLQLHTHRPTPPPFLSFPFPPRPPPSSHPPSCATAARGVRDRKPRVGKLFFLPPARANARPSFPPSSSGFGPRSHARFHPSTQAP